MSLNNHNLSREDIWITSKIPPWRMGYEEAKESIQSSIDLLEIKYIDLILIHWPTSIIGEPGEKARLETWKAIEECKEKGLVKSVGVSNFLVKHLEPMLSKIKEKPVVN